MINKLFVSIVIIAYLLKQTGYTNKEFISKLIKLLNKYPTVDISLVERLKPPAIIKQLNIISAPTRELYLCNIIHNDLCNK